MRLHPPTMDRRRDRRAKPEERAAPAGVPAGHDPATTAEPATTELKLSLTIWLLDEPECPAYARFVEEHPAGTFYHSLAWRNVLVQGGLGRPLYLLAMRGERVVGVLPLLEVSEPTGRRLLSLPATPAAGTLTHDDTARWLLESRALTLAERRGADGVFVRLFHPVSGSLPRRPAAPWIRMAIPALLGQTALVDHDPGRVALVSPDTGDRHALATAGSAGLHNYARHLESCGCAPLHAVELNADGQIQAGAVWLSSGSFVHVLAWDPARPDPIAGVRLLRYIARHGADCGAGKIDFLAPAEPRRLLHHPLVRRTAEVCDEHPLLLVSRPDV